MRAITLAGQKSPGHDLELGGASNKPEPVVERIANRLQMFGSWGEKLNQFSVAREAGVGVPAYSPTR